MIKIYVHIGSTEKIDLNLKLSDTIRMVKDKIAKDRAIPVSIQRLFDRYQSDPNVIYRSYNELDVDPEKELKDWTKLSQIKNDASETLNSTKRSKNEYLRLYLYGSIDINIRTFCGYEFSINFSYFDDLLVDSVKEKILKEKGYPCSLQKLYMGDSSMAELKYYESIMSPQIIANVCNYGLILRLTGKVPLRHIANGTICYPEIDAMVVVSRLKEQIFCQNICEDKPFQLYINGDDIQNLEDTKRLCDYNIRDILSFGLLMKPKPMWVFIKDLQGRTHNILCDPGELVAGFMERVFKMTGVPIRLMRLLKPGSIQLSPEKTLRDYDITDESTITLVIRLCGS